MPFGAICNYIMVIIDQTNGVMSFVLTAYPAV